MVAERTKFDNQVREAIGIWAKRHPCPDAPVLSTADGKTFTPRQLAKEVDECTPFGKKQLDVLWHFAQEEKLGVGDLIEMFASVAVG